MAIKIQNNYTITILRLLFGSIILSILLCIAPDTASAQINLHGVLQNYLAAQTAEDNEFIAARNRFRIQLDKPTNFGGLQTELDVIHRFDQTQEIELQLKEAYFEWFLENYDLRIGHQKIIWGRANGSFITDIITPVDLREFLTVSAEDIRFGITSLNAIRYIGENSLQLVIAPFFQSDLLPGVDSRWFPAKQISSTFSPIPVTTDYPEQDFQLNDIQVALRYNLLSPSSADVDLFLMRWTHPTPAYDLTIGVQNLSTPLSLELVETYQNSWMAGFSSTIELHPKLFFLSEVLFVEKRTFTEIPQSLRNLNVDVDFQNLLELANSVELNNGFLTTKPWIHSMAGLRTEILQTTIDGQYFIEGIFDYENEIIQKEIYQYITLLATRSFRRDRLQILGLSRYNIDTEDFWIQFQGQYELHDNLQLTLGTNLFGGKKSDDISGHLNFSQFSENSFVFSKIALYF